MNNQIVKKDSQQIKYQQLTLQLKSLTSKNSIIINTAIVKAYDRLGVDINEKRLISSSKFIVECFPDAKINDIIEAFKKGARGGYGQTYRMSDQVMCIWIDKYLDENAKDIVFNYTSIPCDAWKTQEEYNIFERSVRFRHEQRNIPQPYAVYLDKAIKLKLGL